MTILRSAWGWIAGARDWLTLIVVAAAAAYFYAEYATIRRDRDQLQHWADVICASSGAGFAPSQQQHREVKSGKLVTIAFPRGDRCSLRVAQLASFKAKTDEQSAQLLADAMRDQNARNDIDTKAARAAAEAGRLALERMEAADAEAERKNLVDREWFAAVNGVAGLRAPPR